MQLLTSNTNLSSTLARLLRRCVRTRWAVAWASTHAPEFELLFQQRSKISQLTVGTHFYQTHPDFIEAFIEHPNGQFILSPGGVFHPKVYYFEHEQGRWDCIVGSANFTKAGFSCNIESGIWLSENDVGATELRSKLVSALDSYKTLGTQLSPENLQEYRTKWTAKQQLLRELSEVHSDMDASDGAPESLLRKPILTQSWSEYFATVRYDTEHNTEGRLLVLEEAARLFGKHGSFSHFGYDDRRGVAGFIRTNDFEWLWFGSMKGAGCFMQAVNQNNERLCDALDCIPQNGVVEEANFRGFIQGFESAFRRSGIATATRLLAFKRPDYFVCLSSKNQAELHRAFNIRGSITLSRYWPEVIEQIQDSPWWNSPEPNSEGLEQRIWRCRTAFLDVPFYSQQ